MSERHQSKRQWNQILSDDDVREIRRQVEERRRLLALADEYSYRNIAARFGVATQTVGNIASGDHRPEIK